MSRRLTNSLLKRLHFSFQILVEFDLQDWQKRDWINVYKDNLHLLLTEENLVLAPRTVEPFSKDGNLHPALVSIPMKFRSTVSTFEISLSTS